jgi:chromosome segregation ATPase
MPLPFIVGGLIGGAIIGAIAKNRKHKKEISSRDEQIDYQQEQISNQNSQINRKNEQISQLKKQVAELERMLSQSFERERKLHASIEMLVQEKQEAHDRMNKLLLVIQRLELEQEHLRLQIAVLEQESQRFVNKLLLKSPKLRRQAQTAELELSSKRNEHAVSSSELSMHESKVVQLDHRREQSQRDLKETQQQISSYQRKKTDLEKQLSNY